MLTVIVKIFGLFVDIAKTLVLLLLQYLHKRSPPGKHLFGKKVRTMRYGLPLLFALLLQISPALGNLETGDSLKDECPTGSDKCLGYVAAVADTLGWTACIPAKISTDELGQTVRQFINDHPENAHTVAFSVVVHALTEAYPCKQ